MSVLEQIYRRKIKSWIIVLCIPACESIIVLLIGPQQIYSDANLLVYDLGLSHFPLGFIHTTIISGLMKQLLANRQLFTNGWMSMCIKRKISLHSSLKCTSVDSMKSLQLQWSYNSQVFNLESTLASFKCKELLKDNSLSIHYNAPGQLLSARYL